MNVVPGYCELLVDIRGTYVQARDSVFELLQEEISKVSEKRGLLIELQLFQG